MHISPFQALEFLRVIPIGSAKKVEKTASAVSKLSEMGMYIQVKGRTSMDESLMLGEDIVQLNTVKGEILLKKTDCPQRVTGSGSTIFDAVKNLLKNIEGSTLIEENNRSVEYKVPDFDKLA